MSNPFITSALQVSTEAIDFQKNEDFYKKLIEISTDLKVTVDKVYAERRKQQDPKNPNTVVVERTNFTNVFDEVRNQFEDLYSKTIQDFTKMTCSFEIEESAFNNAYIEFPKVTRGHPLVQEMWRWERELYRDGEAVVNRSKEFVNVGWVDFKTATVHGVYTKINSRIAISEGLVYNMEPEEIAAVILHEVGHGFYYFAFIGSTVTRNFQLAALADSVYKTQDRNHKVALLTRARKDMDLTKLDPEYAKDVKTKEELQLILVNCERERLRSELGCDLYDFKGFENLADEFATRQGAGVALGTALRKLFNGTANSSFSTFRYMVFEIIKLIYFLVMAVFTWGVLPIIIILIGITSNPMLDLYDDPKRRLKAIRQQLIEAIKDRTNTKNRTIALLADIDALDEIMVDMESRQTFYEWIFTNMVPSHRKEWNQLLFQKELEKLAYNDLFRISSKLNTMV